MAHAVLARLLIEFSFRSVYLCKTGSQDRNFTETNMKKLITISLLLASGLAANQVLADHRHHGHSHSHTEYVCHETGSHYHDSHHYSGHHDYHGSSHVTYTYYSRRPTYSYSYHHYERPPRYHRSYSHERSSTRVRVNHTPSGSLNLRF